MQKCFWNNTVYYTVQQIILRTPKLFVTNPTLRTARIEYIFMTLLVCRPTCVFSLCMHDSCLLLCVGVCYGCIKSHLLQQYVSFVVLGLVRGSLCLRGWYYSVLLEFSVWTCREGPSCSCSVSQCVERSHIIWWQKGKRCIFTSDSLKHKQSQSSAAHFWFTRTGYIL